jgi:ABC-type uncharacterized transport system permease subunit
VVVLKKTRFGYELPRRRLQPARRDGRIPQKKYKLNAMFISGAIAGLGGPASTRYKRFTPTI